MRTLLFIPVAYVAGIEGFGFFLPYLIFVGVVVVIARATKTSAPSTRDLETVLPMQLSELESAAV